MIQIRPDLVFLAKHLKEIAGHGDFDVTVLDRIDRKKLKKNKPLIYYVASLYLQLEEYCQARALLLTAGPASREMLRFCRVLLYCKKENLPLPELSCAQRDCLNYLERVLDRVSLEQVISRHGGFLIAGNAPGDTTIQNDQNLCGIFFNGFKSNTRIQSPAMVHVVTPSWEFSTQSVAAENLIITGNDIFCRRSQVWQSFSMQSGYSAVSTVSNAIWVSLYRELGCSPSAGLLMIATVAELLSNGALSIDIKGRIAGFSTSNQSVNHDYDSEPASRRHNWPMEAEILNRYCTELSAICPNFSVDAG